MDEKTGQSQPPPDEALPGGGGGGIGSPAQYVAIDDALRDLLDRADAGEQLSSAEWGRIGAHRSKLKAAGLDRDALADARRVAEEALRAARPTDAAPPPGPAPVADNGPLPGVGDLPPHALSDADVRGLVGSVLDAASDAVRSYFAAQAKLAGADAATAGHVADAVTLQAGPRAAMVSAAPDVLRSVGLKSQNFPVAVFLCGGAAWAAGILAMRRELAAMRDDRELAAMLSAGKKPAAIVPSPAPPADVTPGPKLA
jgi:hypothetical protein